jgi:hypothetical protein
MYAVFGVVSGDTPLPISESIHPCEAFQYCEPSQFSRR